ncbi:hypothetical protein ACNKHQ_02100 [Shigella flexneri]
MSIALSTKFLPGDNKLSYAVLQVFMQRKKKLREGKRCDLSIFVSEVDLQEARNGVDNAAR